MAYSERDIEVIARTLKVTREAAETQNGQLNNYIQFYDDILIELIIVSLQAEGYNINKKNFRLACGIT